MTGDPRGILSLFDANRLAPLEPCEPTQQFQLITDRDSSADANGAEVVTTTAECAIRSGRSFSLEARQTSGPFLGSAALYGVAGDLVRTLGPHTEADPAALLVSFLTAAGSVIGDGPYAMADGARHPARLLSVIVGRSSRSRKGTSWRNVRNVLQLAAPDWARERIMSGLSSGEGLIAAVGDGAPDGQGIVVGAVCDKRLLVVEEEFSKVLAVKNREGNTLSAIIRECYDTGDLRVMTKLPLVATGAHVSILGHITLRELRRSLSTTDIANGFANRFLWVYSDRANVLPEGGSLDESTFADLAERVRAALAAARSIGLVRRTAQAKVEWERLYLELATEPEVEGLADALLARAEAQLLRLSLLYGILDGSSEIDVCHLLAAQALWQYCADSVHHIFGEATGDQVAERIYEAVVDAGPDGLDREAQSRLFGRHLPATTLEEARALLLSKERVVDEPRATDGRTRHVLVDAKYAKQAREGGDSSLSSHSSQALGV